MERQKGGRGKGEGAREEVMQRTKEVLCFGDVVHYRYVSLLLFCLFRYRYLSDSPKLLDIACGERSPPPQSRLEC